MTAGLAQTPLWKEIQQHSRKLQTASLRAALLADAGRLDSFEIACRGLRLNYALQNVDAKAIELFTALAEQQKFTEQRARMFGGECINTSENRAVLHTALRQQGDASVKVDGQDVIPEIRETRRRMARFADDVREGRWLGATGKPIRQIVNIGIGGSDLGPRLAVKALSRFAAKLQVHFVANADAFELLNTIEKLDPAETLFVIVSKTFTTQETLLNARTARRWLTGKLGDAATAKHFVAVSSNRKEVEKFGMGGDQLFPIWEWVGGRYSLWSAVGLSIMLAIGPQNFDAMLDGAFAMDQHFRTAPLAQNMPVLLALLGIWNRDFLKCGALAVIPYAERLRDLPRYLQQLDMESNGKSVTRRDARVDYGTAPVIFGESGTVGQHSFHQCLHQGSDIIPVDFIGVAEDDLDQPDHHRAVLSNLAAQAGALALGRPDAPSPHDVYEGGRPVNLLLLDRLDPFHFGLLVALYEHKIFTQGIVWDLNSFDQPGVELGKKIARALESQKMAGDPVDKLLARLFHKVSETDKI